VFYPSLQKGDPSGVIVDEDTQEKYTVGFIRDCTREYEHVIRYILDWQDGLFIIPRSDYETLPNVLMQVLRMVQDVKREVSEKERKKRERGNADQS